jgi:hypothetical protein
MILSMLSYICGQVTIQLSNYRLVAYALSRSWPYEKGVKDFCTGWQIISIGNYCDLSM